MKMSHYQNMPARTAILSRACYTVEHNINLNLNYLKVCAHHFFLGCITSQTSSNAKEEERLRPLPPQVWHKQVKNSGKA
jgi:hypothetical protein